MLTDFPQKKVIPSYTSQIHLPKTWYGYDGVYMIIINISCLKELQESQFLALHSWIRSGGFAILTIDMNYGAIKDKRVQSLLPIVANGYEQISHIESFKNFCQIELSSNYSFLILNTSSKRAKILVKENNKPIILEKTFDRGKVLFFTFDYSQRPFNRWEGRREFWEKIVSLKSSQSKTTITLNNQEILSSMLRHIPKIFPSFYIVLLLFFLYIILLHLMLKKLKTLKKPWTHISFILLTIGLFSSLGILFYRHLIIKNKNKTTNFFHISKKGQGNLANFKLILNIFTIQESPYVLSFGSQSNPITHILLKESDKKTPFTYCLKESDINQKLTGTMEQWSHSFFIIKGFHEFPISSKIFQEKGKTKAQIENPTSIQLNNCYLFYHKWIFPIGTIPLNSKHTLSIDTTKSDVIRVIDEGKKDGDVLSYIFLKKQSYSAQTNYEYGMKKSLYSTIIDSISKSYLEQESQACFFCWFDTSPILLPKNQPNNKDNSLTLLTMDMVLENEI